MEYPVIKRSPSQPYYDLGNFGRKISTTSEAAQTWFNRGLTWSYAFNHEEAVACFQQTIAFDPECAMGYWGVAYASGPNYNKTWGIFDKKDQVASMRACCKAVRIALTKRSSPVEKALLSALRARFPVEDLEESNIDLIESEKAYSIAMREVFHQYGEGDLDIITLFADALMNSAPRKMFDVKTGRPILGSPVFEVKKVLEHGLAMPIAQSHPGAPHLYIHLMEMSDNPATALWAANYIRDMVPDAGHMYHMPTHLDILVGAYQRSIDYNTKATFADDKYFADAGGVNFYSYYRLHNYHSLIYAAMLAAQDHVALDACNRMELTITEDLLRVESPPLANWMEFFLAVRVHIFIRFGMWKELIELEMPVDDELYCVTTAFRLYGKGIALAATGQIEAADKVRTAFISASKRVPLTRLDFPNRIVDILKIAMAMLNGELEYRRGNFTEAFDHLREAVAYDDSMHYTEPWPWMVPTRHAYGALSLEQGLVEQAAQAYAEDLGIEQSITRMHQHPKNVWALHGYRECMLRLGLDSIAADVERQLEIAIAQATFPVKSSCLCRLETRACCYASESD